MERHRRKRGTVEQTQIIMLTISCHYEGNSGSCREVRYLRLCQPQRLRGQLGRIQIGQVGVDPTVVL